MISIGVCAFFFLLWTENKELLQQSAVDTRQSIRTRQNRTRRVFDSKTTDSLSSSTEAQELSLVSESSPSSSFEVQPLDGLRSSPVVQNPTQPIGVLIVVPPQVSNFLLAHRTNLAYVRSSFGDYYWNKLCVPFYTNLQNMGLEA